MSRPARRATSGRAGRARRAGAAGVAGLVAAAACIPLLRQAAEQVVALSDGGTRGALALDTGIGVVGLVLLAGLLGWLAVGLLAGAAQALPGVGGAVADRLLDRVVPTVLRATVRTALGLGVLSGSALPALADGPGAPPAGQLPGGAAPAYPAIEAPDRPGRTAERTDLPAVTRPVTSRPLLAHAAAHGLISAPPTGTVAAAAVHGAARGHRSPLRPADTARDPGAESEKASPADETSDSAGPTTRRDHVVRRGDTLWSIAAAGLEAGASDRAIAASWPQWYRANRDVIGADPDVLLPGTRLQAPS